MSELIHYGMPRRSGRYPWGSGKDPYQSALGFRGAVSELRAKGLSEVEIARGLGILDNKGNPSTSRLRAMISLSKEEVRAAQVAEAIRLKDKGMSNVAIGKQMGIAESSVRSLLDPVKAERAAITQATSNMLKDSVAKYGYIDVGTGVENHVGVSRTKLNTAIAELQEQGYKLHYVKVEQVGIPGQYTSVKVLGGPDSTYSEVFNNKDLIQPVTGRSEDFGRTYSSLGLKPVKSVSSDEIMVRYKEMGGSDKDGVIELRRGVSDLDLKDASYAQVRIGVDGTHYLKGMAVYSDDMPDGVNIIFNTNKSDTGSKLKAMKEMKKDLTTGEIDTDNPFGATIKIDGQRGSLNVIREEGDWDTWSKSISSQVLSKQTPALAKKQLDLAYQLKKEEFDDISSLVNPAVKKQLLMSLADDCDASAVHLKAAALPRQSSKVILPLPDLKENEVYAPTYKNGETIVLVRHPHGGTFEIPQLTVNNRSKSGKAIMENAVDAVGIHPKVAQKLSGADFDGDTVITIPNNTGAVKTQASLKGLKDFDPIESYKIPEGSNIPRIKPQTMQTKMGEISNLITDMTIKGATTDELAKAVKHSMVVIDSDKHGLNYKQSYIDNGIASLSEKYQGSKRGGASTIVSQASSAVRVPERKNRVDIDPATGEKIYTPTGATYTNRKGVVVPRTTTITKMEKVFADGKDANALSSGTPMETVYANHANQLKALANTSRKEALATQTTPYSPSARKTYAPEVDSLNSKLKIAQANRPVERQAQIIANTVAAEKIRSNPPLDKDGEKKIRSQALAEARARTGAKKQSIDITPREWEAIQAGAVSNNTLTQILSNTNLDTVKEYATPRRQTRSGLSSARIARAKSMMSSGYTQAEVAQALGVSVSALNAALYD